MCGCKGNAKVTAQQQAVAPMTPVSCDWLGADTLRFWRLSVREIQQKSWESRIGKTVEQLAETEALLTAWILEKTTNPSSCQYMEQLSNLQLIVSKITNVLY